MLFRSLSRSFRSSSYSVAYPRWAHFSSEITHTALNITRLTSLRALSSLIHDTKPIDGKGNSQEIVKFLTLNNISDNPGAKKKGRRVGRGIGCSKGKTCGRGHKGQKARAGRGVHPTFEGGQTKFYKRIPKRGFTNKEFRSYMLPLNVGTLQDYVDMGRINLPGIDDKPLNMKDLVNAGLTKSSAIKDGVKLLGKGKERVNSPIRIEVSRASKGAIEAIEASGGEVTTVHYNKLALRALLKPEKFDTIPRFARPPPKLMPYYTNYKNRGYLSQEIQLKKLALTIEEVSSNGDNADDRKESGNAHGHQTEVEVPK